jgi:tetratricopeptide (TPR) repeat protein
MSMSLEPMGTPPDRFEMGRQCQQAGDLLQAEQHYRQFLEAQPDHADGWHALGTVCKALGKLADAETGYQRAVALQPEQGAFHNSLGIVQAQLRRLDAAAASFSRAVALRPGHALALSNLGNVRREQGRLDEALASYQEAVRIQGDCAEPHNNLAGVLRQLGRLDEAVSHYRKALDLNPGYGEAHYNLGLTLADQKQWQPAEAHHREALRLGASSVQAHNGLGIALQGQGRRAEAEAAFREALRLRPDYGPAHSNLGNVLKEQDRLDEALACYREAVRVQPDSADAHNNLGLLLADLGRVEEALGCYERAVALRPEFPEVHKNRSLTWLLLGNFAQGWAEYEWRWRCKELPARPFREPEWDGRPFHGRTLLLHAEQGLGDSLQFLRYLPFIKQRGGKVVLVCQPPLRRLLTGYPGVDRLVVQGDPLPRFDLHVPLLSVPRVFETTPEAIPAEVPYLRADPDRAEPWRWELAAEPGFKVGIAWQGSTSHPRDRYRSVPLTRFAPLAAVPGVRLYSLQKGAGSEQLADVTFPMTALTDRLEDLVDTAAVVSSLDLVVTVDSAVAHLAGALGVPVWVALPFAPDWRWLLDREDSPWYPTMRLFRQAGVDQWDAVFARMADALRRLLALSSASRQAGTDEPGPLAAARQCHKAGDLAGAELLYRETLGARPRDAQTWYLLGAVYQQLGRLEEALEALWWAVALAPGHVEARNHLGVTLARAGRVDEAAACFRRVVDLCPGNVEAERNLALARRETASRAAALNNRGVDLLNGKDFDTAVARFHEALRLQPDFAAAHNNLGMTLAAQHKPDDALASYQRALQLQPDFAAVHFNRGTTLLVQGKTDEAAAAFREATRLKPDFAEAHLNLAAALSAQRRLDEALVSFRRCLQFQPDSPEAHLGCGNALRDQGQLEAAGAYFDRAVQLRPDFADAHLSRALLLMRQGQFAQGWAEYEWRWKSKVFDQRPFRQPAWDGSPLNGRTILLYAEQGLGDTLHFIRYARLVKERGGTVLVECQAPLRRLLAGCPGVDRLVVQGEALPDFDVQLPLLSLARVFGTTLETVPAAVPYLHADPALVERWRAELGAEGFKVGICWRGNPKHGLDGYRSVPLASFAPLAAVPGVRLFSLQKGAGCEELAGPAFPVTALGDRLDDFADTAAVLRHLDLVVTVDTAVAHLAGALGVPDWVAVPFAPDWRWLLGREDSPWYPTARLFRQKKLGDWEEVFARVAAALAARVRQPDQPGLVPSTTGAAAREVRGDDAA